MAAASRHAVILGSHDTDGAGLSPGQALFRSLVRGIGERRDRLAAWERILPDVQQAFVGQLTPLRSAGDALGRRLILGLDAQFGDERLSTSERRTLSALILSLVSERADLHGDTAMKAVFNRHSASDYDEQTTDKIAAMKGELEQWLGQSLGRDTDFTSSQALLQRARSKLAELQAQEAVRREKRQERRAERAKAKRPAAALRRETLQAELKQSLREIYRKLASALHPDREQDAELRLRKTAMLQEVNQAYDKQDLLRLLEVQIELQQLDRNGLDGLGEDRLGYYNKLLREQVDELDQELAATEAQYEREWGMAIGSPASPDQAQAVLQAAIATQSHTNAAIESDLARVENIASLKRWLKDERRRLRETHE